MTESFGGDQKVGVSILGPIEQRFIRWAAPRVPSWLRSHHLTLATIPICIGIVACGYLARTDERWLLASAGLIFIQWLTDSLDGAVGRLRNEGLVRWGYYMDHLLDYAFLVAILTGYMLLLPAEFVRVQFLVLGIFAGFMISSFLAFGASNQFRISHLGIGPTEIRIVFIVINVLLVMYGKTNLRWSLPYVLGIAFIGLLIVVYRTQKELWDHDKNNKTVR